MSFPRYERYKDSGVEWLGEVPEHWRSIKLRWLSKRYSGGTPDKTRLEYWENGAVPWLSSGEVNQSLISVPSTFITEEAFENSSAKWIPSGALVMALAGQGKTKGMVAQLAIPSTCNQSMAAIVPRELSQARFLFWWLTSNYQNIRNMAGGDLRDGLNLELVGDIDCPLVPESERIGISAFLDSETGKINGLIEEQRQLIELLKEKRLAVVSHAVTEGLDPDAARSPSRIEGVGCVPSHWKTLRVRHVCSFITSGPRGWSEHISETGSLFVQSGDLDDELRITFDSCKRVRVEEGAEASRTLLQDGDTVVCITGAKTGNVAVCEGLQEPAYVNQHLCLIRTNGEILPRFLGLMLKSHLGRTYFDLSQYGMKQGLSLDNVREAPIVLPPLREQRQILDFLDFSARKFQVLTRDAAVAIGLLEERRTALISAAVTGKIDVRNYVPSEAAELEEAYEPA